MALELLARGEPVHLRATGGSMRPFIRSGDRLRLDPRAPWGLGAVVWVAAADGGPGVIHRVVARRADRVLTKGDALPESDGWVPVARVMATVVAIERGGRPVPLRRWRALALSLTLGRLRGRLPH
ncbi:MAG: S24/S26 family peptidase [Myxococcales bacterium]|nr:S24/S26 family peptidase [Myxococcales bacterium]